jgi:hypothetical protein
MTNVIRFPLPPEKQYDSERAKVIRPYLEYLYAHFALNGTRYVWYDGEHPITKKLQFIGADASLMCKHMLALRYIDEKTDFHRPVNFCLEVVSNSTTAPQIPGWMRIRSDGLNVDRLVYCYIWIEDILDVFVINFPQLQEWFWHDKNYLKFGREHIMQGTPNKTISRLIPVTIVAKNVLMNRYLIMRNGTMLQVNGLASQDPVDAAKRLLRVKGMPFKVIGRREGTIA